MLDNCVDAELAVYLRSLGHDAFTAADVGIPDANDDAISVAAQERGAALMSHDSGFARVRRRRTIGQHVWLHCGQPKAIEVVTARLAETIVLLEHLPDVVVEVRPETVTMHPPQWR